jgi:hypothetical protein
MRCRNLSSLLIFVLLMPLPGAAAERHALVIGNGKYVNIDPRPNPPNDVALVSEALKGVGFKVTLRGQSQGYSVNYGIFDASGQQIGYGQGSIDDASHISVTSYWSNGAFLGTGQFHVNHPPN